MSKEITLTEDEKAEILAKRETERIEAEKLANARQFAYDENVKSARESAKNKIDKFKEKTKDKVALYERCLAKLLKVSPDYKLVKENFTYDEQVQVQKLEFIDEEGKDIWQNAKGDMISSWERQEYLKPLKAKGTRCSIKYIGKVPKGETYSISCEIQMRGSYDFNKTPHDRMKISGDALSYSDGQKLLGNAKTVHEKLTEAVKWQFIYIQRELDKKDLNKLALAKAKESYPNSAVGVVEYNTKQFMVKVILNNGIEVHLHIHDDEKEGVRFSIKDVTNKSKVTPDALIGALAKIPTKNS